MSPAAADCASATSAPAPDDDVGWLDAGAEELGAGVTGECDDAEPELPQAVASGSAAIAAAMRIRVRGGMRRIMHAPPLTAPERRLMVDSTGSVAVGAGRVVPDDGIDRRAGWMKPVQGRSWRLGRLGPAPEPRSSWNPPSKPSTPL